MNTEKKAPEYIQYIEPTALVPGLKIKQSIKLQLTTYGSLSVSQHHFDGHVLIDTIEVEFTVPEGFNPIAQAVTALDKQIESIMDEARRRAKPFHEKKAELLQITYQGAEILDAETKEMK